MISDAELNARLLEVCRFECWDKFYHCRNMLRQGYIYIVDHRYPVWHKHAKWGFYKVVESERGIKKLERA